MRNGVFPHRDVGLGFQLRQHVEVGTERCAAGLEHGELVAQQVGAIGGTKRTEAGDQRLQRRYVILCAEITVLAEIGFHWRVAIGQLDRGRRAGQQYLRGFHTGGAERHRDGPRKFLRVRIVDRETIFRQREGSLAAFAAARYLHERHAGLLGEARRHRRYVAVGRMAEGRPQIGAGCVVVLVGLHVFAHAGAECIGADPILDHADDLLTLLVADLIEGAVGLAFIGDHLLDRVRGGMCVHAHRLLMRVVLPRPDLPAGIEFVGGLVLHPGGEALVEPDIVPPAHGDEIAGPLMRHFMRDVGVDAFARGGIGRFVVEQHAVIDERDGAPVFHRTGFEIAGNGDQVQFRQRVGHAEILVVVGQHMAFHAERILRLLLLAGRRPGGQIGFAGMAAHGGEIAGDQRQEVGGHAWRGGELHLLQALARGRGCRYRHVRNRRQIGRHHGGELERGFEGRLVPAGEHAACIGHFELRHQHALGGTGRRLVVIVIDAGGRVRNGAGVVDRQRMRAGGDLLGEMQGCLLQVLIVGDGGRVAIFQRGARQRQPGLVHGDGGAGLAHIHQHGFVAGQCQLFQVRHDIDMVGLRHCGFWQPAGRTVEIEFGFGLCGGGRKRRQRGGGEKGETHTVFSWGPGHDTAGRWGRGRQLPAGRALHPPCHAGREAQSHGKM